MECKGELLLKKRGLAAILAVLLLLQCTAATVFAQADTSGASTSASQSASVTSMPEQTNSGDVSESTSGDAVSGESSDAVSSESSSAASSATSDAAASGSAQPALDPALAEQYDAARTLWNRARASRAQSAGLPENGQAVMMMLSADPNAITSVTTPQLSLGRAQVTATLTEAGVDVTLNAPEGIDLPSVTAVQLVRRSDDTVMQTSLLNSTLLKPMASLATDGLADGTYQIVVQYEEKERVVTVSLNLTVADGKADFAMGSAYEANQQALNMVQALFAEEPQTFDVSVYTDVKQLAAMQSAAAEATASCKSDAEKVQAIHTWMTENIYYDKDALSDETASQNASDPDWVFENKKAVSAGYAKLTEIMLRSVGVPAITLSGHGVSVESAALHVWNAVLVDETWYMLDTAWDTLNESSGGVSADGARSEDYLFPGTEAFSQNHTAGMVFQTMALPMNEEVPPAATPEPTPVATQVPTPTPPPAANTTTPPAATPVPSAEPTPVPSAEPTPVPSPDPTPPVKTAVQIDWSQQNGLFSYDNGIYYYASLGKPAPEGWARVGSKTYYVEAGGKLKLGLSEVAPWWYYFSPETGEMQYGIRKVDGKLYSFSPVDGHLVGGWSKYSDGNATYAAFNGEIQTGFQKVDGKTYYFDPNTGLMARGVQIIGDKKHYFDNNGVPKTGWIREGNKTYHANESGALTLGLAPVGDWWYYFDPSNGEMQYGIRKVNGKLYSFSQYDGHLVGGWCTYADGNVTYALFNGEVQTGFQKVDGKTYYFFPDTGVMARGAQTIDGKQYLFGKDGVVITGTSAGWMRVGDKTYYLNQNGEYQTGLMPVGDWWYYFDPATYEMQYGIRKINGKLYGFSQYDGHLVGGWSKYSDGNVSYALFNGEIQTGFQQVEGNWYYFSPETGVMLRGIQKIGGQKYYFNSKGILQTGWIEVDGYTYYGSFNGSFLIGEHVIGNQKYTFDEEGRLKGRQNHSVIDVSAHQGNINWAEVKASGVNYAILRPMTWSGTAASGGYVKDAYFEYNMRAAKAAGIKVGAYIFTYAFNEAEVRQEIDAFMNVMSTLKADGFTFDLPVFVDYEYTKLLTAVPNVARRTELLRYEMQLLREKGYYPGMYMSTSWAQSHVDAAKLQNEGYDLWIADYRGYNGYGENVAMWQYTSKGQVPGIAGNVDMNYLYKDYTGLISGSNNQGSNPTGKQYTVQDQNSGKMVTGNRLDILAGIVNNEVGGTSLTGQDAQKLYRAQAVAANSWLQYQYQNQQTIPSVGLRTTGKYEQIKSLIKDVENVILTYDGKAANAVYGSCSNGTTNAARDYWNSEMPYLTNVASPYESVYAGGYLPKRVDVSVEAMRQKLVSLVGVDYSSQYSYGDWVKVTSRSAFNYAKEVTVWGKPISAAQFKECGLGIPSPDFTVEYVDGMFRFFSYGNGHCVGMSQFGAMGMIAKTAGCTWEGILSHYYPGTKITTLQ